MLNPCRFASVAAVMRAYQIAWIKCPVRVLPAVKYVINNNLVLSAPIERLIAKMTWLP